MQLSLFHQFTSIKISSTKQYGDFFSNNNETLSKTMAPCQELYFNLIREEEKYIQGSVKKFTSPYTVHVS